MSEQEQNGFEQVERVFVQSQSFLEKNLKTILITVVAVLVVVGGWFGYTKLIAEPREEQAAVELFKAEDRFINMQDSLALAGGGIGEKGLDAIIKEYSSTDAGNLAYAYKGIALYDQGKYQEAIEALKSYEGNDAYVAPSVLRLVGDCHAQLGQYAEAAKTYEQAAKAASNEAISPSCLIKAGHAYEQLGDKAKAKALYTEVKEKYYTTPEASSVEADIARASL